MESRDSFQKDFKKIEEDITSRFKSQILKAIN